MSSVADLKTFHYCHLGEISTVNCFIKQNLWKLLTLLGMRSVPWGEWDIATHPVWDGRADLVESGSEVSAADLQLFRCDGAVDRGHELLESLHAGLPHQRGQVGPRVTLAAGVVSHLLQRHVLRQHRLLAALHINITPLYYSAI